MLSCLSDIGFVLGLELFKSALVTFRVVLMLISGLTSNSEQLREPLLLAFQPLGGDLRIRELGTQLLKGNF